MRGKQAKSSHSKKENRITPAGAGKTFITTSSGKMTKDHPRRCGENRFCIGHMRVDKGSPPQVRGKHVRAKRRGCRNRITPAGAGKTLRTVRGFQPSWDHPRRCGENWAILPVAACMMGSPPQVRGKLFCHNLISSAYRITPAGAGKTSKRNCSRRTRRDHPRRCGENLPVARGGYHGLGSPPQVRGKQEACKNIALQLGITPAGAGKTIKALNQQLSPWDHPRRCGENTKKIL